MGSDYSHFLEVRPDGTIWWPLAQAAQLGAGYAPAQEEGGSPNVKLRPADRGNIAAARALLREFDDERLTAAHPRIAVRDGGRYVEADEFLAWLRKFQALQEDQRVRFPHELAQAVAEAKASALARADGPQVFDSLTLALEDWLDAPLQDLPGLLRARVDREFYPHTWEPLTPHQRRLRALECDYRQDPATEVERAYWWEFDVRQRELRQQLEHWKQVATPTAKDLAAQEKRLNELTRELARMEIEERRPRPDYYPGRAVRQDDGEGSAAQRAGFPYVAYPMAMSQLARRLRASPEELAAWVFCGPKKGGIAAYMHANELDPPPRFCFPVGTGDFDYVQYLMGCWFKKSDLDQFAPADRYITGQALIDRWNVRAHLQALPFIQAKIFESRLMELHPLYGLTRGSMPDQKEFPPVTMGLFALSQVEAIEATDFDVPELVNGGGQSASAGATASSDLGIPDQPNGGRQTLAARTTVRREARKLTTAGLYKRWQIAYRKSKKAHPDKSDVWHSQQIAKLEIAEGRNAETIRKHMKA